MKVMMRSEVPVEETWDLSLLYKTEEAMLRDFEACKALCEQLETEYKGKLTNEAAIVECLGIYMKYCEKYDHVINYAQLACETDYYDTHAREIANRVESGFAAFSGRLSFIDTEILLCSEETIRGAMELCPALSAYLGKLLRKKPHRLTPESEMVLASLSPVFTAPYQIYNMSKLADITFDPFTVDGKEYPLSYALYEDRYEYDPDVRIRRAACDAFYKKLRQYENVTAAAYNAQVTAEKLQATLRGYESVFDYLLEEQQVTREMYDRQIDLITEHLAPHMRAYARKLREIHGLDSLTFADLKIAVDPEYDPKVTIPEAREYLRKGLAILGEDYAAMVEEAFDRRWIDFASNQGKCTGGFCATPYRKNSFILMSWQDGMSDVLTIAHELGHAGHFRLCGEAQNILDTEASTYIIEAPSTMNELLFANYLLKTNDDPRFRRWVYSAMIANTYYHNFVTHLREAWYQREVYRIIDAGGSVNAEVLNDLFRKSLSIFWGDAVELTEGVELTWMRQPHYYMGLYPYTYSAGLTVATQVFLRIQAEGQQAVDDWKKLLAAGGSLPPVGLAALAGVDITNEKALLNTIEYIGSLIAAI